MNKRILRLREVRAAVGSGDPAADLVSALPTTDPVGPNAKARVWAKLHAPPKLRGGIPISLRLAAAAILLMASAALAGNRMRLFGDFSSSSFGSSTESGARAGGAPSVTRPRTLPSSGVPQLVPQLALQTDAESIPTADPVREPEPKQDSKVVPAPVRAVAPRPRTSEAPVAVTAATHSNSPPPASADPVRSMDEAELVLDGLRALRKEGNPAGARALFSQYLAKHPNGALAEDAMGYQLEAADRAGSPDTLRLANGYLSSHPSGRYVGLAQRLRDKSAER